MLKIIVASFVSLFAITAIANAKAATAAADCCAAGGPCCTVGADCCK